MESPIQDHLGVFDLTNLLCTDHSKSFQATKPQTPQSPQVYCCHTGAEPLLARFRVKYYNTAMSRRNTSPS
jgi:hypothetical protein